MREDSDETEGRRLYRAQADALVRAQMAMAKKRVAFRIEEKQDSGRNET